VTEMVYLFKNVNSLKLALDSARGLLWNR